MPKDWADDAERRNKAHVPEAIRFKTKPQIALAQLGEALAAGWKPQRTLKNRVNNKRSIGVLILRNDEGT
jgi:SRSO17 transposase